LFIFAKNRERGFKCPIGKMSKNVMNIKFGNSFTILMSNVDG
jgi:hypothetical protein